MATTPGFASALPRTDNARVTAANTNRDGSGTIVTGWTAPSGGSRIDFIRGRAEGSTTAGMWRVFVTDTAGANPRLIFEMVIAAVTVGAGTEAHSAEVDLTEKPLYLAAGQLLRFSTHNAEAANIFITGADF